MIQKNTAQHKLLGIGNEKGLGVIDLFIDCKID